MTKHKFTLEQCRKGGWTRARQIALERVNNPSIAEKCLRYACEELQLQYKPEYEFWNEIAGYPQFFDVFLPEYNTAIEMDGSHSWHGAKTATKMAKYDEAKRQWCEKHDVLLVNLYWHNYEFTGLPETAMAIDLRTKLGLTIQLQTEIYYETF